ncbi:MAG: hypothetical protein ACRD6Q_08530, partial [Nitrososphaeraceae archaeon]
MTDQQSLTPTGGAKPTNQASAQVSPVLQTATLVAAYARKLTGDERAQQFYAQVSLMAKKEPKLAQCTPESFLGAVMN